MSSTGASASWTMNSFSGRISPMLDDGTRRDSEWKLSSTSPIAG